eukprot:scpid85758/ scgid16968/ 
MSKTEGAQNRDGLNCLTFALYFIHGRSCFGMLYALPSSQSNSGVTMAKQFPCLHRAKRIRLLTVTRRRDLAYEHRYNRPFESNTLPPSSNTYLMKHHLLV